MAATLLEPSGSLRSLHAELSALDWSTPAHAHAEAERLLHGLGEQPTQVVREVEQWAAQLRLRALQCHETSSHLKWFVGAGASAEFILWLHQYKPAAARRGRHAEIAHNHRYWFSSVLLSGGFTEREYQPVFEHGRLASLELVGTARRQAGEAYTVPADKVHSLEAIDDGTLTLLVQGSVVTTFSRVYDLERTEIQTFQDFEGHFPGLLAAARALEDGPAT